MSFEVYQEIATSENLDEEPMVKIGLSGDHLRVVRQALISAERDAPIGTGRGVLSSIVASLDEIIVPMAQDELVRSVVARITRDRPGTFAKVMQLAGSLGIEFPEVLR